MMHGRKNIKLQKCLVFRLIIILIYSFIEHNDGDVTLKKVMITDIFVLFYTTNNYC